MSELHPVFDRLKMRQLHLNDFDAVMAESSRKLTGVFFWGHGCPNCEVAKKRLFEEAEAVDGFALNWFHVNTYEDFDLGTRFGLFGIPTFLFFLKGRKLGKITPFPGIELFCEALRGLREKYPAS